MLNSCFNEATAKVLLCVACLNPNNSFSVSGIEKLVHFARFSPKDFYDRELTLLVDERKNYISSKHLHNEFS